MTQEIASFLPHEIVVCDKVAIDRREYAGQVPENLASLADGL
jgi:hypothetical protein